MTQTIASYTESALSGKLKEFLKLFKKDGRHIYIDEIDTMMAKSRTYLTVDYTDFASWGNMGDMFSEDADAVLRAFARAVRETLQVRYPQYAEDIKDDVTVRISGYPLKRSVREINSKSTGQFLAIKAILIRMSAVESIPYLAAYRCADSHITTVAVRDGSYSVPVPVMCGSAGCKNRDLDLIPQKSKFADYQILQLQELPGELPAGRLPKTLGVFVSGSLVDAARMGDTVEISGIVRPELSREIKLGVEVQTYRHRLYANNIERLSGEDDTGTRITKKERERITAMVRNAQNEDALTGTLVRSFAPHIQGHDLVREALILTMIGADSQTLDDGTRVRGDINLFLVGDPGTAKSMMGQAAYRAAPRAFYASGRGSSGVGLTAATIKDNVTGAYMLEPGITVLADKGSCGN